MATIYRVTVVAEHDKGDAYESETVFEIAGPPRRLANALPMLAEVLSEAARESDLAAVRVPGNVPVVQGYGAGSGTAVNPATVTYGGQGGQSAIVSNGVALHATGATGGGGYGSAGGSVPVTMTPATAPVEPPPAAKRKRRTKAEMEADAAREVQSNPVPAVSPEATEAPTGPPPAAETPTGPPTTAAAAVSGPAVQVGPDGQPWNPFS